MQLRQIPVGSIVHNIELKPGKGGQMARSAGASASFTAREGIYALPRLKSGEPQGHADCRATIGEVSNDEHNLRVYGKAGAKRWLGIRPTVRGRHEPRRSPARWWRRQVRPGQSASGQPVGPEREGPQDLAQQAQRTPRSCSVVRTAFVNRDPPCLVH